MPGPSRRLFLGALALAACPPVHRAHVHRGGHVLSDDEVGELARCYMRAGAALGGGKFDDAVAAYRDALAINRRDDALAYNLAVALAQAGHADEAADELDRQAAGGSSLIAQAREFPGVPEPRLRAAQDAARRQLPPSRSILAARIPEPDLIPEGVAADPRTGVLYVGSLHKRKIVVVRPDGGVADFAAGGDLDSVLGMKVDPARGLLWACSAATPQMPGFTEDLRGRSAVHAFDLATGALEAYHRRTTPGPHLLNDLVVTAAGDLYVSDSEAGELLRLPAGAAEFAAAIPAGTLYYPNGVALADDERTVFVADYVRGLTALDLRSGATRTLRHPRGAATHGLDGLYWHERALVGVDNGAGQGRIVRLEVDRRRESIHRVDVLEAGHPDFDIPTTGAIVGDQLVYIANSQLRSYDADGQLFPLERLRPTQLLRVPLRP